MPGHRNGRGISPVETWDFIIVGAGPAGLSLAAGLVAARRSRILVLDTGQRTLPPGQQAVRPHVLEFDQWLAAGCDGWAPEDVLPHFKAVESDGDFGDPALRGRAGQLPLRRTEETGWGRIDHAFHIAALEQGHPWAPNHNSPGALGVSPLARAADDSSEVRVADVLGAALAGGSVTLKRAGMIGQLVWDGTRAAGVTARVDGAWRTIRSQEVVLCAGAVGTAVVLQRSGVGPPDLLRRAGIAPLVESPVGIGLQTHPRMMVAAQGGPPERTHAFGMMARWNTGLELTASGDMMAWTVSPPLDRDPGWDLQPPPGTGALLVGALAQVFSRGQVAVRTSDPGIEPEVDAALLSDPVDRLRSRLLYRHLSDLISRPHLKDVLGPVTDEDGRAWDFRMTDSEVDRWAHSCFRPAQHYSSTCRMGRADNPVAVVDPECRVYGTEGLRVADSSIFPSIVRADPWLTEAVIGRRAAELITLSKKPSGLLASKQTTEILR